MLVKDRGAHKRVTSPAEKSDIGPEDHIFCSVHPRVGRLEMTYKTDGLAVYFGEPAVAVQHDMRVDLTVILFIMTLEANVSPVFIVFSPQHERALRMVRGVTGQASDT